MAELYSKMQNQNRIKSELIKQSVRAVEAQVASRQKYLPENSLLNVGVLQKLTELKEITKSIFSCEPRIAVQTDPEIPDDHYLLFQVAFDGDVESAGRLRDAWYSATSVVLERSSDKVRLLLTIK